MEHMLHHNVMLFPSGSKMVIVAIVDAGFINSQLPEDQDKGRISFAMGTTRTNIGGELIMQINPKQIVDGEEWGKKCNEGSLNGRAISGILTSPVWFCRKIVDQFAGLM